MTDVLTSVQSVKVVITLLSGVEIDVTQTFIKINFNQSILNSNFINGQLVLADTMDMMSNFPIIGGEKVTITATNNFDSENVNFDFLIYTVKGDLYTFTSLKKSKIVRMFLYTEEEKNSYSRISKKFTGTAHTIVQQLLTDNLETSKTLLTTPTTSINDFVSNYWDVNECLDYINDNAFGTYFDYVFFENFNGYNFQPLSYLFSQPSINTLDYDLTLSGMSNIDNILRFEFDTYFNDRTWFKNGIFGSSGYMISPDDYEYLLNKNTISDIDENINHNGKNKLYNDELESETNRIYVSYEDERVNQIRTTHINFLTRYNFVVQMNGDIGRNIGDMYTINFPNLDNESVSGSDSYSGNWLLIEMNTEITQNNEMKQNIRFVKNALFSNTKLKYY